jgi:hypothetical protein
VVVVVLEGVLEATELLVLAVSDVEAVPLVELERSDVEELLGLVEVDEELLGLVDVVEDELGLVLLATEGLLSVRPVGVVLCCC